eukprot:7435548-Alexandrium_andersonii.AAC.1
MNACPNHQPLCKRTSDRFWTSEESVEAHAKKIELKESLTALAALPGRVLEMRSLYHGLEVSGGHDAWEGVLEDAAHGLLVGGLRVG